VYGNILGGGGRNFVTLFGLKWGMDQILVFGKIGGVGIDPWSNAFQLFLV